MVIPIPTGANFHAVVHGRIPKVVSCAGCGVEYVYFLSRTAHGEAISLLGVDDSGAGSRAAVGAQKALGDRLLHGIEVVPCPNCGFVQSGMIPRAREQRYLWMKTAAFVCFLATALLFMASSWVSTTIDFAGVLGVILWCVTALVALCVPVFPVVRSSLCRHYDPNSEAVDRRVREGRRLATTAPHIVRHAKEGSESIRQDLIARALLGRGLSG